MLELCGRIFVFGLFSSIVLLKKAYIRKYSSCVMGSYL